MDEKELLEKLKSAGLNVAENREIPGNLIESRPHYKSNYGFHHVGDASFQAILIKGVYKDFLRVLEGRPSIKETDWNEIAKSLNTAEAALQECLKISFFMEDGLCFIVSAAIMPRGFFSPDKDMRDYTVPRPLTAVEYMLPASKLYDEEVMLGGGYFGENFPFVMPHFTESVFSKVSDILNPIFVSCNLKTLSPSTVPVYNRLYMNMTSYEKMLKTIDLGNSMFRLSFAPHLYLKQTEKPKQKKLNKTYFPIEYGDIADIPAEITRTTPYINPQKITEDSFFDYPVQMVIAYEYLSIELENILASMLELFPSLSEALKAVFKTRENSVFYSGRISLPRTLDFSSEIIETDFKVEKHVEKIDFFLQKLPFFKRLSSSGKTKKLIKKAHKLLDLRDELYLAAAGFVTKSREALLQIGDIAVSKGKAVSKEDIFYFEYDEVKKIFSDSFFGDASQSINFRKWQIWRYAAQAVPPEIYGADFEKVPQISEQMISKFSQLAEISVLAVNGKPVSGQTTKKTDQDSYEGFILAAKSLPLADIGKYASVSGFLLENAAPFGFVSEFAILKDIPLYTGARFAPLILDGSKIKISGGLLSKI